MSEVINLPLKWLPYIEASVTSVAETKNPTLIEKIEEICAPIIKKFTQEEILKQIKENNVEINDFGVRISTNTKKLTEDWIDANFEILESNWTKEKEIFEKMDFSEDKYWMCLEWVPTNSVTILCKEHIV